MNTVTTIRSACESLVCRLANQWYVMVMGTSGVAVASQLLPNRLRLTGVAFWVAGSVLLVWAITCSIVGRSDSAADARETGRDDIAQPEEQSLLSGTAPVAIMTVGAATRLTTQRSSGRSLAELTSWSLVSVGTGLALVVYATYSCILARTVAEQLRGSRKPRISLRWLMPFVPPMVSATSGAYLLDSELIQSTFLRSILLLTCWFMFLLAVLAFGVIAFLALLSESGRSIDNPWIALGVVGQSVTATSLISDADAAGSASLTLSDVYAASIGVVGTMAYAAVLARTIQHLWNGLPFALSWWSFVFPTVTFVSAFAAAARAFQGHTASHVLTWIAGMFFVLLLNAWTVAATGTIYRALFRNPGLYD